MRQYRGKRKDNGDWVYGHYWTDNVDRPIHYIQEYDPVTLKAIADHEVIPKTVGQSTGLKDKNGKEIWKGDIINLKTTYETDEPIDCNTEVIFAEGQFRTKFHGMAVYGFVRKGNWEGEVIGNVHDNPELL